MLGGGDIYSHRVGKRKTPGAKKEQREQEGKGTISGDPLYAILRITAEIIR